MSYEGWEEHLCARGHRFTVDASYAWDDANKLNCQCGEPSVWHNAVDDTNCDSVGLIPEHIWNGFLIAKAVIETCSHCGHSKTIEDERYRIPTEEEKNNARHCVKDGEYVPLKSL